MAARALLLAVLSLTVAAAAVALQAGRGEAQVAAPGGGPVVAAPGGGRVIIPPSSVARPEDAGVRAHTNVLIYVPPGTQPGSCPPKGTAGPMGCPRSPE